MGGRVVTGSQVNHQYYGNWARKLGFILILFYRRRNFLIDLFIYFVLLLFPALRFIFFFINVIIRVNLYIHWIISRTEFTLRVLLFALFCSFSVKYFNLLEIVKVLGLGIYVIYAPARLIKQEAKYFSLNTQEERNSVQRKVTELCLILCWIC
jgi:hypothetical protein